MGFYVNPSNINFKKCLKDEIYIDKSLLLKELNKKLGTNSCFLCVSRPRRFGKTMAESMMDAYYSLGCDSADLFKNLKISTDPSYKEHLNKYNVLHIDLNGFYCTFDDDCIKKMHEKVIDECKKQYKNTDFSKLKTISECIVAIYEETNTPFIVIIDEYDCLIREKVKKELLDEYLAFLNSMFKSSATASCISLAYLTGILPIVREKVQSKLNVFDEYTIINSRELAGCIGFTEVEVEAICKEHNLDYDECRRWYNGYVLNGIALYTPKSVVNAAKWGEFDSYWNKTSSYEAITDFIKFDFDIQDDIKKMIAGEEVLVDTHSYKNTFNPEDFKSKDDVFTYLIHLGYLAYNKEKETCRIPNYEVKKEWVTALKVNSDYKNVYNLIKSSKELLEATWQGDGVKVAEALSSTHSILTSPLSYNNEKSFQSAIRLAYFYADSYYTIVSELPTGKGYADIAFIPYKPNIPAIIVELKVNDSVNTAIDQIKKKNYPEILQKYKGNLLLVGVSYDKTTKEHSCIIEKA